MRKLLTATLAAVTAAGAIASTAGAAQAEPYRYYGDRHHNNNGDAAAAAIVGGVLGLALGAAIASSNNDRRGYDNRYYDNGYYGGGYDNGYYNNGYYGRGGYSDNYGYARPYAYGYGSRTCSNRERVYDPYTGRRVVIERRYAC